MELRFRKAWEKDLAHTRHRDPSVQSEYSGGRVAALGAHLLNTNSAFPLLLLHPPLSQFPTLTPIPLFLPLNFLSLPLDVPSTLKNASF